MTRTQKLAELGRLAGALAHEIRNPLNALRLNLHTVRRCLQDEKTLPAGEVSQIVSESELEIERLEYLIRSILDYARPEQGQREEIDLRRELEAAVSFVSQLMDRDGIDLRIQAPDTPIWVNVDRARLRQTILNLLNNAHEAIGRGGEISVDLSRRDHWAEIGVTDSGAGITAEHRERIFEPFFTTKDEGCGLGLALVKRFAEEAGGTVVCESDGNRGARFRVCLPEVRETRAEGVTQ
jgi:signal transduction histidine kinase